MYRTLAWHALQQSVDVTNAAAVAALCADWPAALVNREGSIWLEVGGCFPEAEIRTEETSAAVSHVASVPFVRDWMKERQRSCVQFGNLVMEGRDIGSNIFPETPHKFYMDAAAAVRQARRDADGVQDNLAARDQRDSTRAASPLKVAEGATIINNAGETPEQTSARIMDLVKERLGG
jgi:cytidylate kinase